jgi:hypothetical protein
VKEDGALPVPVVDILAGRDVAGRDCSEKMGDNDLRTGRGNVSKMVGGRVVGLTRIGTILVPSLHQCEKR